MTTEVVTKAETQIEVLRGDCLELMPNLPSESVDMVLTDPPYFLDHMELYDPGRSGPTETDKATWKKMRGMAHSPKQGRELHAYMFKVGRQLIRVLKPGGFAVVFSHPRLIHRVTLALDELEFEIRDMLVWRFTNAPFARAFNPERTRERVLPDGWLVPLLRPEFEPATLAQKPKIGTFVKNWQMHGVGLMDSKVRLGVKSQTNVLSIDKETRADYNHHPAVKPVGLMRHLMEMYTQPGQVILDPFLGSGTTAVAAKQTGRSCIGMELQNEYADIAERRIQEGR